MERIEVVIDFTGGSQEYIEDCQVCCNPIVFDITESIQGQQSVEVRRDNE